MTIWAIPGFLGRPVDWDFLSLTSLIGVDWQMFSWASLPDWAAQFNQWIYPQATNILMGYSLGGRLALHALIDKPQQWQAAILISTHIGLTDPQAREKRIAQDLQWAERFEKEEWSSLMHSWNSQEIFAHDQFHFDRQEQDRSKLRQALIHGSLGKQAYLHTQVAALPMPILWITGSQDLRYCQIAEHLTFAHSHSRWQKIDQAGHRAPWAQPDRFFQLIQNFMQTISTG